MRKQLIFFAQVINFCKISSARGWGFNPNPPLAYALARLPQIFRKHSHFMLWEAFFQTK